MTVLSSGMVSMSWKSVWEQVRKEALSWHSRYSESGIRVGDDACRRPCTRCGRKGGHGYVEDGVAGGGDVADGSGVDAAGVALEFANDLHGANFGSPGDGAGGKEGAEDLVEGEVGAEIAGDRRRHLEERAVTLDGEEVFDVDRAAAADAAEIVAEEIDDHDVLAAVFLRPVRRCLGVVFVGRGPGHGTFHGAGYYACLLRAFSGREFGREGEDVLGIMHVDQ